MKPILLVLAIVITLSAFPIALAGEEFVFVHAWGSEGLEEGELYFPRDIAVDAAGGMVFILNSGNNNVQVYTTIGERFLREWGSYGRNEGSLNYPHGIAVDKAGNVYIADTSNNRFQIFTSNGILLGLWGWAEGSEAGFFHFPEGIAISQDDYIYIADSKNHRIQVFIDTGGLFRILESKDSDNIKMTNPVDIAHDSFGNIYVVDSVSNSVLVFTPEGDLKNAWGSEGTGQSEFREPSGIAIDGNNQIYIVDTMNHRIQVFNDQGEFITSWGSIGSDEGRFNRPHGIAIDRAGNIYVADTFNHRIQVFKRSDNPALVSSDELISSPATESGVITTPQITTESYMFTPERLFGIFFGLLIVGGIILLYRNKRRLSDTRYTQINSNKPIIISDNHKKGINESISKRQLMGGKTEYIEQIPTNMIHFPKDLLTRYNPLEFIGEGGFAKVFKAERLDDKQIVAVKIPNIDEKTSSNFIKEVAAWYHLSHKNIVKLNRSDLLPAPHLEMEYIDGIDVNGKRSRDLDALQKPIPEDQTIQIISGISGGLGYAHRKGIYHHDLKPLNVLITSDYVPKIADFGLSKISSRSSMTTNKGYSPLYAAPEQLDSEHYGNPDQRTDLYHLGLIFYELLTGRLPYDGSSHVVIISKILSPEIAPAKLASVNPDLAIYDPIMAKLIAKWMEDRYQTVSEFQDAIQNVYALNKERSELLEDLKITKASLKTITTTGDIQRLTKEAIRKSVRIALLHAQLNDRVELITALNEIRLLTSHHREELDSAINQVQYMIAEDLPLGNDWIDQLRILLGKIEMQG